MYTLLLLSYPQPYLEKHKCFPRMRNRRLTPSIFLLFYLAYYCPNVNAFVELPSPPVIVTSEFR